MTASRPANTETSQDGVGDRSQNTNGTQGQGCRGRIVRRVRQHRTLLTRHRAAATFQGVRGGGPGDEEDDRGADG